MATVHEQPGWMAYGVSMGGFKPWHALVLLCLLVTAAAVVAAVAFVVRTDRRR